MLRRSKVKKNGGGNFVK